MKIDELIKELQEKQSEGFTEVSVSDDLGWVSDCWVFTAMVWDRNVIEDTPRNKKDLEKATLTLLIG